MPEVYGNRYEVLERVGDGGMATVYRGLDRVLKRDVAIKVMHPHLASRNDARARFNREAQAIARLHHGNIVDVYDFSVGTDEAAFLVTEFVHGETLTQFANEHGPFLPQAAALIGHAVAAALGHAHSVGIVHRDIKPDNLMISRDGQIKLMDFGIATAMDLEQMTATGAILGSPAHMAPEQIEGGTLDHRCDIFAFGTVMYFLVTRKLPFVASNPHALFRLILEGRFEPAGKHNAQVDRGFDAIIAQCLARHPSDRYPDMGKLQDALMTYLKQFRMSDVATLLPRFLKAPEVFQFDLKPTLVQVTTAEGRRFAASGQMALAIDAFNRALVLDPDADEPKRGLHELTTRNKRRRQIRRTALAAAVATSLAVLGWGTALLWETTTQEQKQTAVVRPKPARVMPVPPPARNETPVQAGAPPAQPFSPPVVIPLPSTRTDITVDAGKLQAVQRWQRRNVKPIESKDRDAKAIEPANVPVLPVHKEMVKLGSVPPSATLRLRKSGETQARDIGQGYTRRELEDGSWILVCEYPPDACLTCTPAQRVRERRFEVPLKRDFPIKCEGPQSP